MAGFGQFKLTDALPVAAEPVEETRTGGGDQVPGSARKAKGKGKDRGKKKSAGTSASATSGEAWENPQAKNMAEVGRGSPQATTDRSRVK